MFLLLALWLYTFPTPKDSIILLKSDAVVWSVNQEIRAAYDGTEEHIYAHVNDSIFPVAVSSGETSLEILLREDTTRILFSLRSVPETVYSDTLTLVLGYKPVPVLKPVAVSKDGAIELTVETLENPYGEPLQLEWKAFDGNPGKANIDHSDPKVARLKLPDARGDYWFRLTNRSSKGITEYTLMLRKGADEVEIFDADSKDHPWMDTAIIYQLSPYNFSDQGGFEGIRNKLDELRELGVNTLYLQPIFESNKKGQGYDVVDYFSINEKYGKKDELSQLITTAKGLGFKVLFDLVINHTSINHPYALDRVEHGEKSHYLDFYQSKSDGATYSSHYNKDSLGFVSYFWKDLVNLNYDHEEVERWMLEVCKYWVNEYAIDGYRFDAIWGVLARKPEFGKRLRNELKAIRPDLLMLAEGKGREEKLYRHGFDAGYDWTSDTVWVSQWSWEVEYNERVSKTVFNQVEENKRATFLKEAIFRDLEYAHRLLRFTENNDLPRFPVNHGLKKSKMAAQLVFSLPGIPMLYQGQEIGVLSHPYSPAPVFSDARTIKEQDSSMLYSFYSELIESRNRYAALQKGKLIPVLLDQHPEVIAFWREWKDERLLVLLNMGDSHVSIDLKDERFVSAGLPFQKYLPIFPQSSSTSSLTSVELDSFDIIWLVPDLPE